MGVIKAGLRWPVMDAYRYKMKEHSIWYAGDPDMLANFYYDRRAQEFLQLEYGTHNVNTFWGRQIKNNTDFFMHVPIASDIAETSAGFLFGESPLVRFANPQKSPGIDADQKELDKMLTGSGFFKKILEAAESASSMGGIFIKLAWDTDLSPYPIPVIVQPDDAFPEFKFGKLVSFESLAATYCTSADGVTSRVYRHFEKYEKGKIINTLYEGSSDCIGNEVPLNTIEETKELKESVSVPDALFVVYIPNMLPNRMNRSSCYGRSDLQGIESLMDSLDETFSSWMIDVQLARAKMMIPESYIEGNSNGEGRFNIDKSMYVKLDVDPVDSNAKITPNQFAIRSSEFEQTCLNLLDRIITSAGYSPQSFGLNIAGRAESGTALNVRERKSFITTSKKQSYWEEPLSSLVKLMILAYTEVLGGKITSDPESLTIEFCDSISNNIGEISNAVKTLSDAKAISTEVKVRMVHPEWTDSQVDEEVQRILDDGAVSVPDDSNPDTAQLQQQLADEEDEEGIPGATPKTPKTPIEE